MLPGNARALRNEEAALIVAHAHRHARATPLGVGCPAALGNHRLGARPLSGLLAGAGRLRLRLQCCAQRPTRGPGDNTGSVARHRQWRLSPGAATGVVGSGADGRCTLWLHRLLHLRQFGYLPLDTPVFRRSRAGLAGLVYLFLPTFLATVYVRGSLADATILAGSPWVWQGWPSMCASRAWSALPLQCSVSSGCGAPRRGWPSLHPCCCFATHCG